MEIVRTMRWILAVPAAVAGWYLGVIAALGIRQLGERLCPVEYIVSGTCHAPWSSFATDFALVAGSLVCGSLVVLLPALIAPAHRGRVALIAYAAGLAAAAYWLLHGFWLPVAAAALAGGATLWRIQAGPARRPGAAGGQ
jgi:hypothetical protein